MLSSLSISTRLALWYGLSLLILLTLFVAGVYVSVHVGLHRDLDHQLESEAEAVRRHVEVHDRLQVSTLRERIAGEQAAEGSHTHSIPPSSHSFIRLLASDGKVLDSTQRGAYRVPEVHLPDDKDRFTVRHRYGGHLAKTLYVRLGEPSATAPWLEVTKMESALHNQLHQLRWLLVIGVLIASGLAIALGYGLARQSLRPVAVLTRAARAMRGRPSGTLPTDFERKDELTDLAETFNDLFKRLRRTIERERRFRADAAHELYTPLTAIQSEVDVTLRKKRPAEAYRSALTAVRSHTAELTDILDELMTLTEVEAREHGLATSFVNLTAHVAQRMERLRSYAEASGIILRGPVADQTPEEVQVPIESHHVDLIVDHLLTNAIKYSAAGDSVDVVIENDDTTVTLRVEDTGMGFAPEEAEHLFDRFYRSAEASAKSSGGGLGLAIVDSIIRSYGGSIDAESSGLGTGSSFTVSLPAVNRGGASSPTETSDLP